MKKLIPSILILITPLFASGQISQSAYFDAGSNTISSGPLLRLGSLTQYKRSYLHGGAGFQFTFSDTDRNKFSDMFLSGGSDVKLKEFDISADIFYLLSKYSYLTRESDFGIILGHNWEHLDIVLGYNMRCYSLNKDAEETSSLGEGSDLRIWEYRNFIYRGTLKLNKDEADWNISLSVTDYDQFLFQQETNPMFNLIGYHQISEHIKINLEFWYQGAGMLNLAPNHYGYYIRTGIQWQFGN